MLIMLLDIFCNMSNILWSVSRRIIVKHLPHIKWHNYHRIKVHLISIALAMELLESCTKPPMWQEYNRTVVFCSKLLSPTLTLSNRHVKPKTNNLYTVWIHSLNCGLYAVFLIQGGPNIKHISRTAGRYGWWHKRIESSTLARVLLFLK